jgi:Transposase IS116/IS110/IS902 family
MPEDVTAGLCVPKTSSGLVTWTNVLRLPVGLRCIDNLGPAESLRRAVRHRFSLVKRRSAASLRLDALVELLGPGWADSLGSATASKTALVILEKYADPRALKRLGRARLAALLIRSSAGLWREDKADELLAMAAETLALWSGGGIDFTELAHDIASEVQVLRQLDDEIAAADKRIAVLYDEADPKGIVASAPGLGPVLPAAILGNAGDFNRFANLAGVRSFTGFVPKIDQSGLVAGRKGITKAGHAGLRQGPLHGRRSRSPYRPDPGSALPPTHHGRGKHHNSALCSVSAVLITRIAACWRKGELYRLRDEDGEAITEAEGKAACADRFKIDPKVRTARRRNTPAKVFKNRVAGRGRKESAQKVAPATDSPGKEASENVA